MSKQDDLDKLNHAITMGVLSVEFSDRKIIYRSLTEMLRVKNMLEKELYGKQKSKDIQIKFEASY